MQATSPLLPFLSSAPAWVTAWGNALIFPVLVPLLVSWIANIPARRQLKIAALSEKQRAATEIIARLVTYRNELLERLALSQRGELCILADRPVPVLGDLVVPLGAQIAMEIQKLKDLWQSNTNHMTESFHRANELLLEKSDAPIDIHTNSISYEIDLLIENVTKVINKVAKTSGLPYKLKSHIGS